MVRFRYPLLFKYSLKNSSRLTQQLFDKGVKLIYSKHNIAVRAYLHVPQR